MAYRRTERVAQRLAARHDAIIAAARAAASEGGMPAVQIAEVAARAGVAAGTVYRYFPAKTDLVDALVAAVSKQELAAFRRAVDAAPGPLSALAAAIATFVWRVVRDRRLAAAMLVEPVDADVAAVRLGYRRAVVAEFEAYVRAAMAGGQLPQQDVSLAATVLVGILAEGSIGPLAPPTDNEIKVRANVQALTLYALRALGVTDARARGLVVQTVLSAHDGAT
jgi:AcrR family transcriptional regulator